MRQVIGFNPDALIGKLHDKEFSVVPDLYVNLMVGLIFASVVN